MKHAIWLSVCLLIAGCGGGGGGGRSQTTQVPPPPPVNRAPIASAGSDQQVVEETSVSLDGTGSQDSDDNIASFAWAQISGPSVMIDGAASATATFVAPAVDQDTALQFELTVTDVPGAASTDTVDVLVVPLTVTLSGTITAARGIDVDGDVNDPDAPLTPNNHASEAQAIANPVTVGGYVNQPGWGEDGALLAQGDISDFYRVSVVSGQHIALQVADPNQGDPDLYLWDASGTSVLAASVDIGASENVVVPHAGEVLIEVTAYGGASNYTLILGQSGIGSPGGLELDADFVPGQIILERRTGPTVNLQDATLRMSLLGVHPSSGATGRPFLAQVEMAAGQLRPRALGAASTGVDRAAAIADDHRRRKYDTLLAIKALRGEASIIYAQPNYRVEARAVPNDPRYSLQWHYPMIDLPAAWDVTFGDPSVSVAVIDTGVLLGHPDLAGQLAPGYDFISDPARSADGNGIDPDPNDNGDGDDVRASSFHGTHVAGTIAAATNNGMGVAGVAPGVRIVPLRVLGIGGGTTYDVIQAVRFAAGVPNDSGIVQPAVDVMNLSLGRSGFCTPAEQGAFDDARAQGVVVVVAAGNDSMDAANAYPANCHGVIAVGAVDLLGDRTDYSNFGSSVDVQAPGGDLSVDQNGDGYSDGILSSMGDERADPPDFTYAFWSGTSMATPHVAGVVALMKSVNPTLTPDDVDQLLANGEMTDERGVINAYSAVYAALDAIAAPPDLNPTLTVTPTSLNFGSVFTHSEVDVRVSGGGSLQAGVPTVNESWLSVSPANVTEENIGRYRVSVDRGHVSEGTHTAVISIGSDNNTVEVPVIMQVSGTAVDADAGHLYVLLMDAGSGDVAHYLEMDASEGRYVYEFPAVEPGDYEIIAGTDFDHDLYICDGGERCGVYPTLDYRGQPFTVDGDRTGLNFSVGDVIPVAGDGLRSKGDEGHPSVEHALPVGQM